MKPKGGKRAGAGRKRKVEEEAIITKLSPMDNTAFAVLLKGVKAGDFNFVKLFMEYRFGKPASKVALTDTKGNDLPIVVTLNLG